MQALIKERAATGAVLIEAPRPTPAADEVLIEVAGTSICGTDRHLYEWTPSARAFDPVLPLVFGHETAGTVVATGAAVKAIRVGDRVSVETHVFCGRCYPCRTGDAHNCARMGLFGLTLPGAFAAYAIAPERVCFVLPDEVSFDAAALFEPAGVAVHALERAGPLLGASVLVSGCGPIGLMLIALCRIAGAARIFAAEPVAEKRAWAADLGAIVLDPLVDDPAAVCGELRRGGVDVAFECSGAPQALPGMLAAIRREGRAVTIGHPGEAVAIDVAATVNKGGVTLAGVFGRRVWSSWETLVELVSSRRFEPEEFITLRLPLEQFEQAITATATEPGKVLLQP
ncbi:MAG: alcohol dehydrogenase catalytic domain-containing protein [Actinobacteria bacterium]|nr:alcohol dehydrogenase catalytic domain-containing protein [Actinomycetota bacterium]